MLQYKDAIKVFAKTLRIEEHDNAILDIDDHDNADIVIEILSTIYDDEPNVEADLVNEMYDPDELYKYL